MIGVKGSYIDLHRRKRLIMMKRLLALVILTLLVFSTVSFGAVPVKPKVTDVTKASAITMLGKKVAFTSVMKIGNFFYVPVMELLRQLGPVTDSKYDVTSKTLYFSLGGKKSTIKVGEASMTVADDFVMGNATGEVVVLLGGRMYVPLSFIGTSDTDMKVSGNRIEFVKSAFLVGQEKQALIDQQVITERQAEGQKFLKMRKADTDGDGLSDYHEVFKYNLNPNNKDSDGDGMPDTDENERREKAGYTVKAKLEIKKPYDLKDMQDDYQDVKLISESSFSAVVEVILYRDNKISTTIRGNTNWKEYAKDPELQEYLKPSITANWDEGLKQQIIADLKKDGYVYADFKTDLELVATVAPWIWKTSKFNNEPGPTDFVIKFDGTKGYLDTRWLNTGIYRDAVRNNWTEKDILENHIYGKSMYQIKSHGACSSSSIYQNTILRALGIPTRITNQIPLMYGGSTAIISEQFAIITKGILNNPKLVEVFSKYRGMYSHYYNEVYINGQWVRLNYGDLGANTDSILDPMGILINLETTANYEDLKISETWSEYRSAQNGFVFRLLEVEDRR